MNVQGKVVVVTGAGRGIGWGIAIRMAAEGARVVVNDLDSDAATTVAAEGAGLPVPGDAATEAGVRQLLQAARGHLGVIDFANAPYSVSKHVAFAEWHSATDGHRGITVQATSPQGVKTRILENVGPVRELVSHDIALESWQALHDDRYLIFPHPQVQGYYQYRATNTDGWLASMGKLQSRLNMAGGI